MPDPYTTFGLSCPSGGSFYICQNNSTEFIGCCTIDPCRDGSGSCPQANLRNASFSADSYDGLKPQECVEETGLFYTCKYDKPPFLGCCVTNPCASESCPAGDLVPAKLSSDPAKRDIFLTTAASSTRSHTPTATATPSGSSTPTPSGGDIGARLSTGTIAGISVGVAITLVLLSGGCVYGFRRGWHARKRKERDSATPFYDFSPGGQFRTRLSSPSFAPYRGEQQSASNQLDLHRFPSLYFSWDHSRTGVALIQCSITANEQLRILSKQRKHRWRFTPTGIARLCSQFLLYVGARY